MSKGNNFTSRGIPLPHLLIRTLTYPLIFHIGLPICTFHLTWTNWYLPFLEILNHLQGWIKFHIKYLTFYLQFFERNYFIFIQLHLSERFLPNWILWFVIPIKKRKSHEGTQSYLILCIMKTMERTIKTRLQRHIENCLVLLLPSQFGFCAKRSIMDAVNTLTTDI